MEILTHINDVVKDHVREEKLFCDRCSCVECYINGTIPFSELCDSVQEKILNNIFKDLELCQDENVLEYKLK